MGELLKTNLIKNCNEEKTAKGWTVTTNSEEMEYFPRLFQNDMLLSKILSDLNPQDLLGCRLLCKVWNSEASKILGKRITLTLDFRYPYYLPSSPVFQGMSQVGEKLAILLPDFAERQKYTPPQLDEGWKPSKRKPIHPKMLTQLSKFLSFPNQLSTLMLNLAMTNSNPTHISIITLILEKLSQTLKTLFLQVHVHFGNSDDFEDFPPATPSFTLPSLTTFSHFSQWCDDDDSIAWVWDESLDFASFFTPLFTEKVEKFSFNRNNFKLYCQNFLKTGKKPEMKELYLKEVLDLHFGEFLELEIPLKSLEISSLIIVSDEENFLDKIIKKLAPTLERLVLTFSCAALLVEIVSVFPKLKEFSLAYECPMENFVWGLDGRVEYSQMFPALSSLSVIPLNGFSTRNGRFGTERNRQGVFDSFFPENCDLKIVKIPMLTEEEGLSPDYSLYRERLRTIAKMFPNACNAGWKEWRDFSG